MSKLDEILSWLHDTAVTLEKAQVNFKKCPKVRLTKGYIEAQLECVQQYWCSYKEAHQQLVKCVPKDKHKDVPHLATDEFFHHEGVYLNLIGDLKDLLSSLVPTTSGSQKQQVSAAHPYNNSELQVKLPRIQLPIFGGNYDEWMTFHDLFTSLVHNNATISKVQKLHYLKTSLSGEAEALLRHIQITENNYEQSWDLLKGRYGNKRLIVNSLLKRMFSQKKITVQTSNQIKALLDTTTECLRSLETFDVSIRNWDPMIIHLVVLKLDPDTHKEWEEESFKLTSEQLPTWEELRTFLETKFRTLELVAPPGREKTMRERTYHTAAMSPTPAAATKSVKSCLKCKGEHTLSHCKDFAQMQIYDRFDFVKGNNLCFNCLLPGHPVYKCRLTVNCQVCRRKHHSLLHQANDTQTKIAQANFSQVNDIHEDVDTNKEVTIATHFTTKNGTALLATALVPVRDAKGHVTTLRALVDQGSQASFITERAAQLMKTERTPVKGTITGVGSTRTVTNSMINLEVLSRYDSNFNLKIKAYVMATQVTSQLPSRSITDCTHSWSHLQGLTLADPSYHTPGRIDLLLGVNVYAEIIKGDIIKGPPGSPCAQNTSLGWILFGDVEQSQSISENVTVMHHHLDLDIDTMLRNMWELDSSTKCELTAEEKLCEETFNTTTTRSDDGRYIVKLPTKTEDLQSTKGQTRDIALKRFNQLEKRMNNNEEFKKQYTEVIEEYLKLGHMEEVPSNEMNNPSVYLPHHAVIREEKETSKVRVVFDASCKGTNNVSLNDELLVGPQIQEDLRNLVMRWRMKQICYIADVKMMYRQIYVSKGNKQEYNDADLQRIVWRKSPEVPIQDYRLLRVTFGTASAPYLAVKVLQQTAEDEGQEEHPSVAKTIKESFYVDDLLSGHDSVSGAVSEAKTIQAILQKGGFSLQKWASNSSEFLKQFEAKHISSHVNLSSKLDGNIRALGISWNMGEDIFQYQLDLPAPPEIITKRRILAETQRLFDPLGWLAPTIVPAKILIQKLWLKRSTWDEEVEPENKKEWLEIRQSFNHLKEVKIDRWVLTLQSNIHDVTIHGFCDSSERAYAGVAYLRVKMEDGTYHTKMIAAKARVAPVKPVSLPRLELCGAVLLASMLRQISYAMRIASSQIFAWTDSTIVLAWLQGDPAKWQTFVRNRVVSILDDIGNKWFHVQSQDNPADIASRGLLLPELARSTLWWKGPAWLETEDIPYKQPKNTTDLEMKKNIQTNTKIETENNHITNKFEEFDNLTQLLVSISYCKRFLKRRSNFSNKTAEKDITTEELDDALKTCIRLIQIENYPEEIEALSLGKPLKRNSTLKSLNPYMDHEKLLRVGGRLRHSNLKEESKHPIILNNKNNLTQLIVADAHQKTLHGGPQLMLCFLRTKYWIVKPKGVVKSYVHKCLICARQSAVARHQIMGDLPQVRVTPARVFLHSATDFAGPYTVLTTRGRGAKTKKAYVAIFICMAVKAVHLELVGDLTSEAFIGAFQRFVARRGRCSHMWSDQGRNFVGANRELEQAFKEAKLEISEIPNLLAREGTQWHFIPAYSPNFGGLWEAGVKSIKHHLKRVLNTNLTFEEFSTVLCQVEACLNSRPLSPMDDSDIENLNPLTPGHFLIGEAPLTVPSPDLRNVKVSHLSRWQHTQKIVRDFWHRWQQEYLSRLQQRPKWLKQQPEFEKGQIVLIKNENLPPGKWLLGRVVDKHPGQDGVTRVYSVKSGDNITKRSISKLCNFPVNTEI